MSPGNIKFKFTFFLKIYIITVHPAGTSDRSDICEGSKFVIEVLQLTCLRQKKIGNIHKQLIHLTKKIILHNY